MNCAICKTGELKSGEATVTLERGGSVIVFRGVPAQVCDDCGEYYLDQEVAARVYRQADDAVARQVDVEVVRYAA